MESLPKVLARNARSMRDFRKMSEPDLVKAGVAAGSVNRVMHGQNVTLNVLAEVAKGLRVPAWFLLHPGMQPGQVPPVPTEGEIEAEVERRVKERMRDVLTEWLKLNVDPEETRSDGRSVALPFPDGPATKGKSGSGRTDEGQDHEEEPGPKHRRGRG